MNKHYLVISIDVEPDCTPTWHYSNPLSFDGVKVGIKNILHPLFLNCGAKPTYLINNVVLENDASVDVLLNLEGPYELGAHLHPEFIEPHKLYQKYDGKKGEANLCSYDKNIQLDKIINYTGLFEEKFNHKPTSFRAGRFSIDDTTLELLSSAGYLVDSSVTPYVNWNDKTREVPVNYLSSPEQPYFHKSGILEVPVSITVKRRMLFKKQQIWLRPHFSGYADFLYLIKKYANKYKGRDIIFNMMFHNVEVIPNCSPYVKSETEKTKYLHSLESLFEYCSHNGIEFATLSEIYAKYKK